MHSPGVGEIQDEFFFSLFLFAALMSVMRWLISSACEDYIHRNYNPLNRSRFGCRYRWYAIALCLTFTALGAAGTYALEKPPTSEPPIFDSDHNVQVCTTLRSYHSVQYDSRYFAHETEPVVDDIYDPPSASSAFCTHEIGTCKHTRL